MTLMKSDEFIAIRKEFIATSLRQIADEIESNDIFPEEKMISPWVFDNYKTKIDTVFQTDHDITVTYRGASREINSVINKLSKLKEEIRQ